MRKQIINISCWKICQRGLNKLIIGGGKHYYKYAKVKGARGNEEGTKLPKTEQAGKGRVKAS